MGFIHTPNIPIGRLSHCIVGETYSNTISDLLSLGITPITLPPFGTTPIANHADIVCHHLGNNNIVMYPYDVNCINTLKAFGFNVIHPTEILGAVYPHDILLNGARVGDYLICNRIHTATVVVDWFTEQNIIDTAQGYAKCSTLVVSPTSIVTSDISIAKNVRKNGVDVLHIKQGNIALDGYEYGFIGGCGTLISINAMYFTGDIYTHCEGRVIVEFLRTKGIETVCGSGDKLIDIGSILPIMEY